MSSVYYNQKAYDKCIACCQQVLKMNPSGIVITDRIYAYHNMGKAYRSKSQYQKASYYSQSAMALASERDIKDTSLLIDLNVELGFQQGGVGNNTRAVRYLHKAEQLAIAIKDSNTLCTIIANIAILYKSKDYALRALLLGKSLGNVQAQLRGASTLCGVYLSEGRRDSAWHYMKIAEATAHKLIEDKSEFISSFFTLAYAQYDLKEYDASEKTLKKTLEAAEQWQILDRRIPAAYDRLADLYAQRGAWQQAFLQQKKAMKSYSHFLSETDARNAQELEARYQAAEKDKVLAQKQLQIVQQENRLNRKNTLIGSISLGALMLGMILYNRIRHNKQKQNQQEKEIFILKQQQELMKQEMEINHLKDKIEGEEKERLRMARELHDGIISQLIAVKLHFKGALQNIRETELFSPTLQYLDEATTELRKTAHNLMPENVIQNGLVPALRSYCRKMETASGIKIYFEHFGQVQVNDKATELALYRIVQELVQNAVKHAEASHILVELNAEDSYLALTVEDNGIGGALSDLQETSGFGLKSIKSRVDALGGNFEISSAPGKGTAINLEFTFKAN